MDKNKTGVFLITILIAILLLSFAGTIHAADNKGGGVHGDVKIDAAELQLQVMAFADRYYAILFSAFEAYEKQAPPDDDLKRMMEICTYSISSAFTSAAEPNPVKALFDLVVMVTLGHTVFKNDLLPEHGPQLQPLVDGFLKAKSDIWEVSAKILTPEQQQTLKTLIAEWRKKIRALCFFLLSGLAISWATGSRKLKIKAGDFLVRLRMPLSRWRKRYC